MPTKTLQIVSYNNFEQQLATLRPQKEDTLNFWLNLFFSIEVSNSVKSQKQQHRDIEIFRTFLIKTEGTDNRLLWTPRLTRLYLDYLRIETIDGQRRWSDRTINRMLASLKTFAKWVDFITQRPEFGFKPFPLGNPMRKIKAFSIGNQLEIERALTESERRKILNAADQLLITEGFSNDRNRYKELADRPRKKYARPYRDRAIIYLLTGSPVRRAAVVNLKASDFDFKGKRITVLEKGAILQKYVITKEAAEALNDYLSQERELDNQNQSPYFFLGVNTNPQAKEGLSPESINHIWNKVCKLAGVENKTPHSTRHYMGRKIADKTRNPAAVQLALGHKNASTSLQYMRVTYEELDQAMEETSIIDKIDNNKIIKKDPIDK